MAWRAGFLCCLVAIGCATSASAEVLASWTDPSGDDKGGGAYTYPTNAAFGKGGEADILLFSIEKTNGDLIFVFKMRNLVDPWSVGNRLTMVAVAIDADEGGDPELRRNANVLLERPSEYQVFAAGETMKKVTPSAVVLRYVKRSSGSQVALALPPTTSGFTVAARNFSARA